MLRTIIQCLALVLVGFLPSNISAEVFKFDNVKFERENHGGGDQGWSQLIFRVDRPFVGTRKYRNAISFTLDTDRTTSFNRTDIRFKDDWLSASWYGSTSKSEAYIGTRLSTQQRKDVENLTANEKVILGWIITNADELIDYALASGKPINSRSRTQWQRLSRNELFEKNLRENFGRIPAVNVVIRAQDKYARHTPSLLKNRLQPQLKKMGFYKGSVDGLIGPGTVGAIKDFERTAGLFPDGILRENRELKVLDNALKQKLIDKSQGKDSGPSAADRFHKLNELAQNIRITSFNIASFPNETNAKLTDIILEANFHFGSQFHDVKINGDYLNEKDKYSPGQLCVVNHHRTEPAVCMHHSFNYSSKSTLSRYLEISDKNTVDLAYLKCAIVWQRYDELYNETRQNLFIRKLYQQHRDQYVSVARKCMDTIIAAAARSTPTVPGKGTTGKDDRFFELDKLAKSKGVANLRVLTRPHRNRKGGILSLDGDVYWNGRWNKVKLLGERLKPSGIYRTFSICVAGKPSTGDELCLNTNFPLSARNNLSMYLQAADTKQIETIYFKCAIIREKMDVISSAVANPNFRAIFVRNKQTYANAGKKCTDLIREFSGGKKLEQQTSDLPQNVGDLQNQVKQLKSSLEMARATSANRLKLIRKLTEEVKTASREKSSTDEARVLENRLADAQERLAAEKLKLRQHKDEVAPLLADAELSLSKLQSAQNLIDVLQSDLGNYKSQIDVLEGRIAQNIGIELQNSDLRSQLAAAKREQQQLNNINAGLNSALDVAELESEAQLEDLIRKESEVRALSSQLIAAQGEAATLFSKVSDLESRLAREMEVKHAEIAELNTQIKSLKEELSAVRKLPKAEDAEPKGFELSADWDAYKQWITPSQMRFCNILYEYEVARDEAANSGNQLLQNMAIKERDRDLAALLTTSRNGPSGFRNWVSVVQSVFAMDSLNPATGQVELAAGVILDTPCGISVGTGRVLDKANSAKSEFKYLAFENDLIFSQLASIRRGDPVLFDGSFAKSENSGAEMFITNELGEEQRVEAYEKPDDAPDMFVDISYLAKL